MVVWSVQPKTLYEQLQKDKVIRCCPEKSECITEFGFANAYNWMAEQMALRIGEPPEGVVYPIWAWYSLNKEHKRPDLRGTEFRYYEEEQVCLELEIPDEEVLLSDECAWHMVLNDMYYTNEEDEFDKEYNWFCSLPKDNQEQVKRKSWENVFDLTYLDGNMAAYIQATFWELKLEYVREVRFFKGRKSKGSFLSIILAENV